MYSLPRFKAAAHTAPVWLDSAAIAETAAAWIAEAKEARQWEARLIPLRLRGEG